MSRASTTGIILSGWYIPVYGAPAHCTLLRTHILSAGAFICGRQQQPLQHVHWCFELDCLLTVCSKTYYFLLGKSMLHTKLSVTTSEFLAFVMYISACLSYY